MADFMGPVVDWLIAVLQAETPGLLRAAAVTEFAEFKKSWTGVVLNWPALAVMPVDTAFDPEGTAVHGVHRLTVKFCLAGQDPDQVTDDALAYMRAIDAAIAAGVGSWLPQISKVFVQRHDYGPLYAKGGGWGRFPELDLVVETYEV